MVKSYLPPRQLFLRLVCILPLALGLIGTSGCNSLYSKIVHHSVKVPPLLEPRQTARAADLMAAVNRFAALRSLRGKVDIEFEDTSFAQSGIAEKYRTAEGTVIVQRPGQIYLIIQGPLSVDIAQMTSDGEHFRIAVLRGEDKYRRFVRGTNNASYNKLSMDNERAVRDGKNMAMTEQRAFSALSNLRPQHLTDALLIRPVLPRGESGFLYAQSEFYQEEPDTRPRAKSGARVVRGYYLLDELEPAGETGAHLLRRFWFDRVGGIRFARLQTFDKDGALVTDVQYGDVKSFGEGGKIQLPARVELTRPQDGYKLNVTYQSPAEVVIDREYEPGTFILQNKWQLPEKDLDAGGGKHEADRQ